jgi:hypothetical protein
VRLVLAPALVAALLVAAAARAEPVLEVKGSVVTTRPRLQVSVVVSNRGDHAVPSLEIAGELFGQRQKALLPSGVVPGGSGTVVLAFEAEHARPGVHALVLLLEYPIEGAPDAAGNPPLASRVSWLPVTLGADSGPALRLEPKPIVLEVKGPLEVAVGSTDGIAHRVRLRVVTPRGLRSDGEGLEVDVPARGAKVVALPLVRAGAARGTRHTVLLVAETVGALVQTTVATATVQVADDPSLLPHWRIPILVLACLLLGVALGFEAWIRSRRS